MGYETWIAIGVIVLIIGAAALYVIKAKKSGNKCIGCPGGGCSSRCSACCCGCQTSEE